MENGGGVGLRPKDGPASQPPPTHPQVPTPGSCLSVGRDSLCLQQGLATCFTWEEYSGVGRKAWFLSSYSSDSVERSCCCCLSPPNATTVGI